MKENKRPVHKLTKVWAPHFERGGNKQTNTQSNTNTVDQKHPLSNGANQTRYTFVEE